jgi:hypothetical protein
MSISDVDYNYLRDSSDLINSWIVQFLIGQVSFISGLSQSPVQIISNLNK